MATNNVGLTCRCLVGCCDDLEVCRERSRLGREFVLGLQNCECDKMRRRQDHPMMIPEPGRRWHKVSEEDVFYKSLRGQTYEESLRGVSSLIDHINPGDGLTQQGPRVQEAWQYSGPDTMDAEEPNLREKDKVKDVQIRLGRRVFL